MSNRAKLYTLKRKLLKSEDDGQGGGMNEGIFLVERKSDKLICVKKIIKINVKQDPDYLSEVKILERVTNMNTPYVNQLVDFEERKEKDHIYVDIYIKYCDLLGLDRLLIQYDKQNPRPKVPEAFIWHVFASVTRALCYLHFGGPDKNPDHEYIIHGDLKPGNIFLTVHEFKGKPHPYPAVVLGDFGGGVTKSVQDSFIARGEVPMSKGYTPYFAPPEPEWDSKGATDKGDVYAIGVCILQLMYATDPLKPGADGTFRLARAQMSQQTLQNAGYSTFLQSCVRSACIREHELRPNSRQLLFKILKYREEALKEGSITRLRETPPLPSWSLPERATKQPPTMIADPRQGVSSALGAKPRSLEGTQAASENVPNQLGQKYVSTRKVSESRKGNQQARSSRVTEEANNHAKKATTKRGSSQATKGGVNTRRGDEQPKGNGQPALSRIAEESERPETTTKSAFQKR